MDSSNIQGLIDFRTADDAIVVLVQALSFVIHDTPELQESDFEREQEIRRALGKRGHEEKEIAMVIRHFDAVAAQTNRFKESGKDLAAIWADALARTKDISPLSSRDIYADSDSRKSATVSVLSMSEQSL